MYWKDRKGKREIAAIGAETFFPKLPQSIEEDVRLFGGMSFSKTSLWKDFPDSRFFLPKWEIEQSSETTLKSYQKKSLFLPFPTAFLNKKRNIVKREDFPNEPQWKQNVQDALKKIETKELKKVVLARRTDLYLDGSINPYFILKAFQHLPNVTTFLIQWDKHQAFVGATPEKLYVRKNNEVTVDALAGTHKNSMDPEEDIRIRNALLKNLKEQNEFAIVEDFLKQKLESLCESFSVSPKHLYSTAYLHHLYSKSSGLLKKEITDLDLLLCLHPTPALGGSPIDIALASIDQYEPFPRGWYGSPIGWACKEEADFSVGIRSALIKKNCISLFAGVGIVENSDPLKEWEELENKIIPFMKVLC